MEQINDPHNLKARRTSLEQIEIAMEGEYCDGCVRKLREPLPRICGVQAMSVNIDSERVVVTFERAENGCSRPDVILRSGYMPAPLAD
jgi:copper chaperone CopZ